MVSKQETPEARAQRLLDEFKISTVPVMVDKVAKQLGAQLKFSPLDDELSGMVFVKNGSPIIGINSLHHSNRQRFSIAHEIGHLVMHRDHISNTIHVDKQFSTSILRRDATSAAGTERLEIEANQFAAALLIPRATLEELFSTPQLDIVDDYPINEWAKIFKVSPATLEYRIKNYLSAASTLKRK